MSRRRRVVLIASSATCVVAAVAVALVLLLTRHPAPAKPAAAPTAAPSPTPAKRGPLLSPFTGEPVRSLGPVVAVKIDNIVTARPQTGLNSADIMYVLPVEGGLTRFCAIFSSRVPKTIGPVRSARQDDLGLLAQFGKPGFSYSGATPHLLPFIQRADTVDLYSNTHPGYFRSSARVAPENLYANGSSLLAQARKGGASDAHDIGFRFSATPPSGGRAAPEYTARFPAASYTFRWSSRAKRWLVSIDGRPDRDTAGGQLGGATIVLQYTTVTTSRFLEYGKPPPYAYTTGSGRAVVLRNGRAYTVTWKRPSPGHGTVFRLPSGQRMTFAPGQVWVLFLQK